MQTSEFELFVTDLCDYLEHKAPRKETMQAWFADCRKIPGECLPWTKAQFKDPDRFPSNFPKWLLFQYRLWLEAHPEKKAKDAEKGCDKCHKGWITVSQYQEKVGYQGDLVFRCGHCNAGPGAISAKTTYQLVEAGYCQPVNTISFPYCENYPLPPADENQVKVWQDERPLCPGEIMSVGEIVQEVKQEDNIPF